MASSIQHPLLLAAIIVFSFPVYRGVALAIFGNRQNLSTALRYWLARETWAVRPPSNENWRAELRLFVTAVLCIGFIAALYSLSCRHLL